VKTSELIGPALLEHEMTDEKLFRFVGAGENTPTHIPCRVFVADLRRVFEAGRQAGAASRDAEVARLQDINSKICQKSNRCITYTARLEEERDQLRAQINVLREAATPFTSPDVVDETSGTIPLMDALEKALSSTPEQSLAEYRNKVIEECAKRAEAYAYMSQNFNALAEELRAMKEQP
jgi:hypothetical protein